MRFPMMTAMFLVLFATAVQLNAQTVSGVVRDAASGAPIIDASVVLLDSRGRVQRGTLSEPDGSFVLMAPEDGEYTVRVGAAGYATKDSPELRLDKDETAEMDVLLISDDPAGGPPGFNQRMERGEGEFLSRQTIEESGSHRFTELLRYTPGVTIVPLPSAAWRDNAVEQEQRRESADNFTIRLKTQHAEAGFRHRLEASEDCVPVLWVDGVWWGPVDEASDRGPDNKFLPDDIEAIELYNHPSILPAMFNSGREAEECGVVVMWSREGLKR